MSLKPTGITANRQTGEVTITWEDGHDEHLSVFSTKACLPVRRMQRGS